MFSLFVFASLLVVGRCDDSSSKEVEYGSDGNIRLYYNNGRSDYVRFKFEDMDEYDTNGEKVGEIEDFTLTAAWSGEQNVTDGGVRAIYSYYQASVEQKDAGNFSWITQVWLFLEQGYVPYGDANDTTVSVLRGSMKFALEIDGYNFTSMDNTLRISCKVETEGGEGSEPEEVDSVDSGSDGSDSNHNSVDSGDDVREKTIYFDDASFQLPEVALIDNVLTNITIVFTKKEAGNVEFYIEFPAFHKLYYDPVFDLGTQSSNANKQFFYFHSWNVISIVVSAVYAFLF